MCQQAKVSASSGCVIPTFSRTEHMLLCRCSGMVTIRMTRIRTSTRRESRHRRRGELAIGGVGMDRMGVLRWLWLLQM